MKTRERGESVDAVSALMFALVATITLLPLFVVLPTAPPMWDDARPTPVAPPRRAGWRISITVARVEAQHP